jgi:DNA-directed RNA polymerase subunit RPC12/RpoP
MRDTKHAAEYLCLGCGKGLDGSMSVNNDATPSPGDLSICFYCGHLQAYGDNGFRALTDEEMADVAGDPMILRAQAARAEAMEKREWQKRKQNR